LLGVILAPIDEPIQLQIDLSVLNCEGLMSSFVLVQLAIEFLEPNAQSEVAKILLGYSHEVATYLQKACAGYDYDPQHICNLDEIVIHRLDKLSWLYESIPQIGRQIIELFKSDLVIHPDFRGAVSDCVRTAIYMDAKTDIDREIQLIKCIRKAIANKLNINDILAFCQAGQAICSAWEGDNDVAKRLIYRLCDDAFERLLLIMKHFQPFELEMESGQVFVVTYAGFYLSSFPGTFHYSVSQEIDRVDRIDQSVPISAIRQIRLISNPLVPPHAPQEEVDRLNSQLNHFLSMQLNTTGEE
jgi:hypothetical protein